MEKFRFLTAGESHGKGLTAIIEGIPAGFDIDLAFINRELQHRQQGCGRGGRMQIETDTVEILSGIRFGKTLGSPLTLFIKNKDFDNWAHIMSADPQNYTEEKSFTAYRPGHADYAGSIKYNHKDLRNVLERSSARQTAVDVAIGAVAKQILKRFGIECFSKILQIGNAVNETDFHNEIDLAKESGDTLGGKFEIVYTNLPIGLGSYVHWDRKLDGRLAQAVMSIPAVKSVEIGDNPLGFKGSEYHDQIYIESEKIVRKTNHAGGLEGGMTNGEPLIVRAVMKPLPTLRKPLKTIDAAVMKETEAHFERSDICAVEACTVVAEARIACILVNEMLMKFGADNLKEMLKAYNFSVHE